MHVQVDPQQSRRIGEARDPKGYHSRRGNAKRLDRPGRGTRNSFDADLICLLAAAIYTDLWNTFVLRAIEHTIEHADVELWLAMVGELGLGVSRWWREDLKSLGWEVQGNWLRDDFEKLKSLE